MGSGDTSPWPSVLDRHEAKPNVGAGATAYPRIPTRQSRAFSGRFPSLITTSGFAALYPTYGICVSPDVRYFVGITNYIRFAYIM